MRFGAYLPPQAERALVPAVYFLAGLTCTEETFAHKAGAQRAAATLGLALITCDTSPRHARVAGDDASWDFGQGAGFYVDATRAPWSESYKMYTYVTRELVEVVEAALPVEPSRRGIMGHSMGGHGALVAALSAPGAYASASAFAPIVAPSSVPWGQKAFAGYLGDDPSAWDAYDATALIARGARFSGQLLVDQGTADKFLDRELQPERLKAACDRAGQQLSMRMREGYDHSYHFIASFVDEHLRHHAAALLE